MNKESISLKSIAADIYGHPRMRDIPFETIISLTHELIQITGCPYLFDEKEEVLRVKEHRAMLPCDYYDIRQLKLERGSAPYIYASPMRSYEVSDIRTYEDGAKSVTRQLVAQQVAVVPQHRVPHSPMFKEGTNTFEDANFHPGADFTYKIQERVLITSIPEGEVRLAYLALKMDDEGWPMVINNASFLRALKSYIKMQWFTQLFESDELGQNGQAILQNAQQDYYANIAQAQNALLDISPEKMHNIANILNDMMPRRYEHATGYNDLNKEHSLRVH